MAMLNAGVPLKSPIAGIAMGLMLGDKPEDEPLILSDILGLEDALGTMDFKVAGSFEGVTTFQLDIKSEGLTIDVLRRALDQVNSDSVRIVFG
jgi:polyribonucleotide nucleotidyltransferase